MFKFASRGSAIQPTGKQRTRSKRPLRRLVRFHADGLEDTFRTSKNSSGKPAKPPITAERRVSALSEQFHSEADLRNWLIQAATTKWEHLFGKRTFAGCSHGCGCTIEFDNQHRAGTATTFQSDFLAIDLQPDGLEEADFVKSDGDYLYVISGKELSIVRADEDADLDVLSRVRLDERPTAVYLAKNRLATISSGESNWCEGSIDSPVTFEAVSSFDSHSPPSRPSTTVTVLDIADRKAPKRVRTTTFEGRLVSSQIIGDGLRLVLTNVLHWPMPLAKPLGGELNRDEVLTSVEMGDSINVVSYMRTAGRQSRRAVEDAAFESRDEYVARISDQALDFLSPRVCSFAADGSKISDAALLRATDIYRPDDHFARSLTTVVTFDIVSTSPGATALATVITDNNPQANFAVDSIYVFATKSIRRNPDGSFVYNGTRKTSVWMFAIDAMRHSIELAAKGDFDGNLLSQFSDEQSGYQRKTFYCRTIDERKLRITPLRGQSSLNSAFPVGIR
jgi:beta propeller domain-containing protein